MYLVNIVVLDSNVEQIVEGVEQVHDLVGRALGGQVGEPDNVTEEDRHAVEALRLGDLAALHLVDNLPRKQVGQQLLRLLLLLPVRLHSFIVDLGEPFKMNNLFK